MARKTASRLAKRREAEAADALDDEEAAPKKKKKAAKKKTTRARAKKKDVLERRRIVWAIYSGTMKEDSRFPYDQRAEADAKLEALRAKSKKTYFLQALKEPIPPDDLVALEPTEEEAAPKKKKAVKKKAAKTKATKKKA